jgi:hypothetical protein
MKSKLPPTLLEIGLEEKRKEIQNSFLLEWSREQFTIVQTAISKHFLGDGIITETTRHLIPKLRSYNSIFDCIDRVLGLAYTSSSSYAGYWVCNVTAINPKYLGYHYTGFALSSDNKAYAILWDKEENEIIIPL